MEGMTNEQFERLAAYDLVIPLDHQPRMLGFIAWMMASYFGLGKNSSEKEIRRMCMPWLEEEKPSTLNGIKEMMKMDSHAMNSHKGTL